MRIKLKGDSLPQLQLMVVLGSQYAALAKNENGLKAEICAPDSGVMDWRLARPSISFPSAVPAAENRETSGAGTAWTKTEAESAKVKRESLAMITIGFERSQTCLNGMERASWERLAGKARC